MIYDRTYGIYKNILDGNPVKIYTETITNETWDEHYRTMLNIFKDHIEKNMVQDCLMEIYFSNNNNRMIYLSTFDYFINLILWRLILENGEKIKLRHIYFKGDNTEFCKVITRKYLKKYIDDNFVDYITPNSIKKANNAIADTLHKFIFIDNFSLWLANTINLEDDIKLAREFPEIRELLNVSKKDIPIEQTGKVGMELVDILTSHINNSPYHCFKDFFLAEEGVKLKQFKEFDIMIAAKPNGEGGIFAHFIPNGFANGGLTTHEDFYIEDSTGRTAEMLSKNNVGESGAFARILGLNNQDTFLNEDPESDCGTRNLIKITIDSDAKLKKYNGRYYRFEELGNVEKCINYKKDKQLIGQTIYLRSPITCASNADGHGICSKCYGKLASKVRRINIGKIAAQILSSILTQMLLSARHLLEAKIKQTLCSNKELFDSIFSPFMNIIYCNEDMDKNVSKYYIYINIDDIVQIHESEEGFEFNEYITNINICDEHKNLIDSIVMYNDTVDNAEPLYITAELAEKIAQYINDDDNEVYIPVNELFDTPTFMFRIYNNELSKTLEKLMGLLDRVSEIKSAGFTKEVMLSKFMDIVLDVGLPIDSVHCELIISNQIRDTKYELEKPDWTIPNAPYQIYRLTTALEKHPNVTIGLLFQDLSKQLYSPITYLKHMPSRSDYYFMPQPQNNNRDRRYR